MSVTVMCVDTGREGVLWADGGRSSPRGPVQRHAATARAARPRRARDHRHAQDPGNHQHFSARCLFGEEKQTKKTTTLLYITRQLIFIRLFFIFRASWQATTTS